VQQGKVKWYPDTKSWIPCCVMIDPTTGVEYRAVDTGSDHPFHAFSGALYAADGGQPIDTNTKKPIDICISSEYAAITIDGKGKTLYRMLAFLFGCPNNSGVAMTYEHVVDHIESDKKMSLDPNNLQFLKKGQNSRKGNRDGTVIRPQASWVRHNLRTSWVEYNTTIITDPVTGIPREYRMFLGDHPEYGAACNLAFPMDGTAIYRLYRTTGGKAVVCIVSTPLHKGYPRTSPQGNPEWGEPPQVQLDVHRAVAFLWKAPNESGGDMSELLEVDHIDDSDEGALNYSLDNLRFLTTTQNTKCKKPRK
jgi:hypothetical protein